MSCNKSLPHIIVIPEDDANKAIANGFEEGLDSGQRNFQIVRPSGGWLKAIGDFNDIYLPKISIKSNGHIVLLIDFDNFPNRLIQIQSQIPKNVSKRVFVLGAKKNPEELKRARLGSYEAIGKMLFDDCRGNATATWEHELLKHNSPELQRMNPILRPILFPHIPV